MSLQPERANVCPRSSSNPPERDYREMTQQPQAIPWLIFPEQLVLRDLLAQSTLFCTYYQTVRGKICGELYWAQDASLPEGIDYRRTILSNTGIGTMAQVIRLRRVPAISADAMGVAHELQHFVLDREGYPTVGASPSFETLSAALASMIHDPVVNARLRGFGFDLQLAYDAEVREGIRQLSILPHAPARAIDQVHWLFNFTSKLLDRDQLGLATNDAADAFQTWFALRYPAIATESHNLRTLINHMGYALPAQQLLLFNAIIQRYHLERALVVLSDATAPPQRAMSTPHA